MFRHKWCIPRSTTGKLVTMTDFLLFALIVAICGLCWWASYRIEPHWVSKDGRRVVCYGQGLSNHGEPIGRWRETKLAKLNASTVEVRQKGLRTGPSAADLNQTKLQLMSPLKARQPAATFWNVVGVSPEPPRGKAVYLLGGSHGEGVPPMIAVRLPAKSKAIPMLDELLANRPNYNEVEATPDH